MEGGHNFSSGSLASKTLTEQRMIPKSPLPGLVDFHGKRKQMVKIQVLEREIGVLQEELKSLEGLHPASRCCKELDAFVGSISDPFTPIRKETDTESHHFRKQICCVPWICWSSSCLLQKKVTKLCCSCCSSSNLKCTGCNCFKTTSKCAQNCC